MVKIMLLAACLGIALGQLTCAPGSFVTEADSCIKSVEKRVSERDCRNGNDAVRSSTMYTSQCKADCISDPLCVAFNMHAVSLNTAENDSSDQGTCSIYHTCTEGTHDNAHGGDSVLFFMNACQPTCSTAVSKRITERSCRNGNSATRTRETTASSCKAECIADSQCVAFDMHAVGLSITEDDNSDSGTCYIYHQCTEGVHDSAHGGDSVLFFMDRCTQNMARAVTKRISARDCRNGNSAISTSTKQPAQCRDDCLADSQCVAFDMHAVGLDIQSDTMNDEGTCYIYHQCTEGIHDKSHGGDSVLFFVSAALEFEAAQRTVTKKVSERDCRNGKFCRI